jgi:hypothetical protein
MKWEPASTKKQKSNMNVALDITNREYVEMLARKYDVSLTKVVQWIIDDARIENKGISKEDA